MGLETMPVLEQSGGIALLGLFTVEMVPALQQPVLLRNPSPKQSVLLRNEG